MDLRPATAGDLREIAQIQAASTEASQWAVEAYLTHRCAVATEGDTILGFLVTRPTAPAEHEILNLAVRPEARRKGVGTALLLQALTEGGDWFLEARESNLGARRLYESLGFSIVGVRRDYYASPPESGIVMRKGKC